MHLSLMNRANLLLHRRKPSKDDKPDAGAEDEQHDPDEVGGAAFQQSTGAEKRAAGLRKQQSMDDNLSTGERRAVQADRLANARRRYFEDIAQSEEHPDRYGENFVATARRKYFPKKFVDYDPRILAGNDMHTMLRTYSTEYIRRRSCQEDDKYVKNDVELVDTSKHVNFTLNKRRQSKSKGELQSAEMLGLDTAQDSEFPTFLMYVPNTEK